MLPKGSIMKKSTMRLAGSRKMLSMLLKSSRMKETFSPHRGEGVGHAAEEQQDEGVVHAAEVQQDEESSALPKSSRSCPCCSS